MLTSGDTIVLADAHFESLDHHVAAFCSFLARLREQRVRALYILGDLFSVWVGTPKMRLPHQYTVVQALQSLADHDILVNYVEGNRDYCISPTYLCSFHAIATESLQGRIGAHSVYFSHGDLVNTQDIQYRLWRQFSRNPSILALFNSLPRSLAMRFSHFLEQKFRETNTRHKSSFPVELCQQYAEQLWAQGYDVILLGHFHEERHFTSSSDTPGKHLYVLPGWKECPRYLRISQEGDVIDFEQL